jgi:hypothetical protein
MSKLGKLIGKKAKAVKGPDCDCESCCTAIKYTIRAMLNKEKCWNEELKTYLIADPITYQVIAVTNQEVEFQPTDNTWRYLDWLREGIFDSLTFKVVK